MAVHKLTWHMRLIYSFSSFEFLPEPAFHFSFAMSSFFGYSDYVIALLLPFFGSGRMLPNQPAWEHDPWSRKAPQAPLQQNPPAPFSHRLLFIITQVFSPLVTSYWNATLWAPHLNLCELHSHLSSAQVQHYNFRFVKFNNIFFSTGARVWRLWRCSPEVKSLCWDE